MSKVISSTDILQSVSDAIVGVAKQVSPSVVRVGSGRGSGSGVVWSSDGHIVTSNHIVERSDRVEIGLQDSKSVEAKVMGQDYDSDIALLKVEGVSGLQPIKVGDSTNLQVGQFVLAVGNPFGEHPAVTSGIITSSRRSFGWRWGRMLDNVVITDARLNPGYSGGPLVDAGGKMIGVNAAYMFSRGIAIPINTVKSVADKLAKEGRIKRGHLGVVLNDIELPEEIAKQPQINQDSGLMIVSVSANSPAKRAGVSIGDIIVKLDGQSITGLYDLHRLLTDEVIGKETKLSVLRAEKLTELKITPSDAVSQ